MKEGKVLPPSNYTNLSSRKYMTVVGAADTSKSQDLLV